jgi:hypothetical protein
MRIPKRMASAQFSSERVVIDGASFTAVQARAGASKSAAKRPGFFRSARAISISMKRSPGVEAPYSMPEQIAGLEDVKLQFARQLYDDCLERHGEDHQETRLLSEYISNFDNPRRRQR